MFWKWGFVVSVTAAISATLHLPISQLPIQVESEADKQAWGATLRIAERHQLTLYDAAHLELALRRSLPLATLDKDLRRDASARKVRRLG